MKTSVTRIALLLLAMTQPGCPACEESVPAGHIGRTWEPGGISDELLPPGTHNCWGRCQMLLMETGDANFTIPMEVLCTDQLNFKFEINILASVDQTAKDAILWAFSDLNPVQPGLITTEQLFTTYIKPIAQEKSRNSVSRYATTDIAVHRAQVIEEVKVAVLEAFKGGMIVKIKQISVGNLDFPDIITRAQEAKAQRRIEIDTAKAEGEKRAAMAQARLTLARIEANERLLRAQSQADANRILASSVSPQLLAWRQYEVMEAAAAGQNNMFSFPYTDVANKGLDTSKWLTEQGIVDAALLQRIQDAQESAKKDRTAPLSPLSFPNLLKRAQQEKDDVSTSEVETPEVETPEVETPAIP